MHVKQLEIINSPELGSYVGNLNFEDIILEEYYFATNRNILSDKFTYSDHELELILYLTDTEYHSIIVKCLDSGDNKGLTLKNEYSKLQSNISEQKHLLDKIKKQEEEYKKYQNLRKELTDVERELGSSKEILAKKKNLQKRLNDFEIFKKLNLDTISGDLMQLEKLIYEAEWDILQTKAEEISSSKRPVDTYLWDKGSIIFGLAWLSSSILLGYFFQLIELEVEHISSITYFIGGVLCLFFIINARKKVNLYEANIASKNNTDEPPHTDQEVTNLMNKRKQILQYVQCKTADEFFSKKAYYNSVIKELDHIQGVLDDLKISELENKSNNITEQLSAVDIKESTNVEQERGSVEKYIQSLESKKKFLQNAMNTPVGQELAALKKIKQDLKTKIPNFTNVLKNHYEGAKYRILKKIEEIYSKTYQDEEVSLDNIYGNWDNINLKLKFLVQFYLLDEVYKSWFDLIVSPDLTEGVDDKLLKNLDEEYKDVNITLYLLK